MVCFKYEFLMKFIFDYIAFNKVTSSWTQLITMGEIPNTRCCTRYFSCFDNKTNKIYVLDAGEGNSYLYTLDLGMLSLDLFFFCKILLIY